MLCSSSLWRRPKCFMGSIACSMRFLALLHQADHDVALVWSQSSCCVCVDWALSRPCQRAWSFLDAPSTTPSLGLERLVHLNGTEGRKSEWGRADGHFVGWGVGICPAAASVPSWVRYCPSSNWQGLATVFFEEKHVALFELPMTSQTQAWDRGTEWSILLSKRGTLITCQTLWPFPSWAWG